MFHKNKTTNKVKSRHKLVELSFSEESPAERNKILVLLLTILLQTMRGHAWSEEVEQTFLSGAQILDYWSKYRIARASTRYY